MSDIRDDFARLLLDPKPPGMPLDAGNEVIEQLAASGANVVDIRANATVLYASLYEHADTKPHGFGTWRVPEEDRKLFYTRCDALPLVEPMCWPINGWWLIRDELLLSTHSMPSDDSSVEAFAVYPVVSNLTQRFLAEIDCVPQETLRHHESLGVDLDSQFVGSPTGWITVRLDHELDAIIFDLGHRLSEVVNDPQERWQEVVTAICVALIAANLMSADSGITKTVTRPEKVIARQRRKYGFAVERTTTIDLPGLKYTNGRWSAKTGAGIAWHMVRGHWRNLTSERYREKRGARVWVRPHTKGNKDLGSVAHNYRMSADA